MNRISIVAPGLSDFGLIKDYMSRYELDARGIEPSHFLTAKNSKSEVVGFGRIRHYKNCDELCSLGVIETERRKGIGTAVSQKLIHAAIHPLYLVCIIPFYFERLGFKIVSDYPEGMQEKLDYCTSALAVPEKYVVMRYFGCN